MLRISALCAFLSCLVLATDLKTSTHPQVGDWFDALWWDDLIKIPLTLFNGAIWVGNLQAGDDPATAITNGTCYFDNNSNMTTIYSNSTTGEDFYDPDSSGAKCDDDYIRIIEDG